ncbi:hypothetical protein DKX38_017596 [Salix brachista]|uniref:Transcription elongation factor 1 homolog n=2 Tax=Salix brachista TaxID=2182728 RepID=A0A5N5KVP3_9ROSI|nr:hypothetical protein DKX38_017596 [Salix brachista]
MGFDFLCFCIKLECSTNKVTVHLLDAFYFNLQMGKRKSSAKPPPRKRMDKLDTVFSCPFCNHGTSVECRIDMKNLIGEAVCGICQESFSMTITGSGLLALHLSL